MTDSPTPASYAELVAEATEWRWDATNVAQTRRLVERLIAAVSTLSRESEARADALKEIAWSNDSKWQADRARTALGAKP